MKTIITLNLNENDFNQVYEHNPQLLINRRRFLTIILLELLLFVYSTNSHNLLASYH